MLKESLKRTCSGGILSAAIIAGAAGLLELQSCGKTFMDDTNELKKNPVASTISQFNNKYPKTSVSEEEYSCNRLKDACTTTIDHTNGFYIGRNWQSNICEASFISTLPDPTIYGICAKTGGFASQILVGHDGIKRFNECHNEAAQTCGEILRKQFKSKK